MGFHSQPRESSRGRSRCDRRAAFPMARSKRGTHRNLATHDNQPIVRCMALAAAPGMAGLLCDAAPVDADRRQDATGARADAEPLVAGPSIPNEPRTRDVADAGG